MRSGALPSVRKRTHRNIDTYEYEKCTLFELDGIACGTMLLSQLVGSYVGLVRVGVVGGVSNGLSMVMSMLDAVR